jgi:dTDP-glucose 4,6-dehydratase
MDPEQYLIADETCDQDVSKAERELHWIPKDSDTYLLIVAYKSYKEIK